jgi:hypothetical protein
MEFNFECNFYTLILDLRGGPLEIQGGGGNKMFAAQFFFSLMSLQDFLMHLTSARIFFQDYLHFAVCLNDFFL